MKQFVSIFDPKTGKELDLWKFLRKHSKMDQKCLVGKDKKIPFHINMSPPLPPRAGKPRSLPITP
jgi:hypothetical protein